MRRHHGEPRRKITSSIQNLSRNRSFAGGDRDAKFPVLFDRIPRDAGIQLVRTGVRISRMSCVMERWVQTCRHALLDRTLNWNEPHLRRSLREFEQHHNAHRPHQALQHAAPLRSIPEPITDPERISRLDIRRYDRLGGVIHGVPPCRAIWPNDIFGGRKVVPIAR